MKFLKGLLNLLGTNFAIILSVLLFVTLIITPIISGATNLITPKTIQSILASIDYKQLLIEESSNPELNIENTDISVNAIQGFMKTEALTDILELYSNDVNAILSGEIKEKEFTPEAIKDIINDKIDDISDSVFELSKEENPQVTKEEIKADILKNIDESSQELSKLLPDTEELIDVDNIDDNTSLALKTFTTGNFKTYMYTLVVILSLLIFGCRFARFKGFVWLAVVYILGSLSSFGLKTALTTLLHQVATDSLPISSEILTPAINIALSQFITNGIVLLVLAVLCITAFILCKIYLKKKNIAFAHPITNSFETIPETSEEITEPQETTQD